MRVETYQTEEKSALSTERSKTETLAAENMSCRGQSLRFFIPNVKIYGKKKGFKVLEEEMEGF